MELLGSLPSKYLVLVIDYYSSYYVYYVLTLRTTTKLTDSLESIFSWLVLPGTQSYEESDLRFLFWKWYQTLEDISKMGSSKWPRKSEHFNYGMHLDFPVRGTLRKGMQEVFQGAQKGCSAINPANLWYNRKMRGSYPTRIQNKRWNKLYVNEQQSSTFMWLWETKFQPDRRKQTNSSHWSNQGHIQWWSRVETG